MWPKSNAKVVAWRQDSEWTCGQSQNGQNDRHLRFGSRAKTNLFISNKCRSQNMANCPSEYVAQSLPAESLPEYDFRDAIHFFDRFFQYQTCGIDSDIWVDMWPKVFGQFGHVA